MPQENLGVNQLPGATPSPAGTSGAPQAPQTPPAGSPTTLADGTPSDKPVPYERLAAEVKEKEALKAQLAQATQEAEFRRQQDIARLIAERNVQQMPIHQQQKEMTDEELNNMAIENPAKAMREMLNREKSRMAAAIPNMVAVQLRRQEVIKDVTTRYPEITNPNSEFARNVANVMARNPQFYQNPEGLRFAVNDVVATMSPDKVRQQLRNEEVQRQSIPGVEGAGTPIQGNGAVELDNQGKFIAGKLGIDEKVLAQRVIALQNKREGGR